MSGWSRGTGGEGTDFVVADGEEDESLGRLLQQRLGRGGTELVAREGTAGKSVLTSSLSQVMARLPTKRSRPSVVVSSAMEEVLMTALSRFEGLVRSSEASADAACFEGVIGCRTADMAGGGGIREGSGVKTRTVHNFQFPFQCFEFSTRLILFSAPSRRHPLSQGPPMD